MLRDLLDCIGGLQEEPDGVIHPHIHQISVRGHSCFPAEFAEEMGLAPAGGRRDLFGDQLFPVVFVHESPGAGHAVRQKAALPHCGIQQSQDLVDQNGHCSLVGKIASHKVMEEHELLLHFFIILEMDPAALASPACHEMLKIGPRRAAVKVEPVEFCPGEGPVAVREPAVEKDDIPSLGDELPPFIGKEHFTFPDIKKQKSLQPGSLYIILRAAGVQGLQLDAVQI